MPINLIKKNLKEGYIDKFIKNIKNCTLSCIKDKGAV